MRVYKAFLLNEIIILKRNMKWLPLFFLLPLGFVVAPYLNRYNISGFHYSDQLAGVLAISGMLLGILMFSGIFSLSSTCFEKTEGMHYFIFSQDINKLPYMLAKITSSLSLSVIGSLLPLVIYYGANLYQNFIIPLPIVLSYIIAFSIMWTMSSIICAQFFYKTSYITMGTLAAVCLLLTAFISFFVKFQFSVFITFIILLFMTLGLAIVTYFILNYKESKLGSE